MAVAAVAAVGACAFAAGSALTGGDDTPTEAKAPPAPPLPQLPGGGRRLFPDKRIVAFYGAPQDDALGTLGIGTPAQAGRRLLKAAAPYERKTRPVLPAMELIATIDRYLRAARRIHALLVLDIQPGRAGFVSETRRLAKWLREPDVALALDPEWHVAEGQVPGQVIGSVDADIVDEVGAELSKIVRQGRLPEKLLLIHQFTQGMIVGKETLTRHPGVALTINVDGFGDRANKVSKYEMFTDERVRFNDGFKLFYEEDTNLMSPAGVLALRPPPDVVVYE